MSGLPKQRLRGSVPAVPDEEGEMLEAIRGLSPEARELLKAACARAWTVADGLEAECGELGRAGLCWWKRADPNGAFEYRGHTILTPYPAARVAVAA